MLSLSCELQNQKGSYDRVLIIKHEYSVAYKREFITCTNIDNPVSNFIVPVIKENGTYYVDYSLSNEMLKALYNSMHIPAYGEIQYTIKDFAKKDIEEKEVVSNSTSVIEEDGGETITETKQKVIAAEKIDAPAQVKEQKNTIINIGLNDNEHMVFRVKEENKDYYICEKITDEEMALDEQAEVIETTFTMPNYYKLVGANNISSANGLYTKIAKSSIISNSVTLHVLIVKCLDKCYANFIIKNETQDSYEIEPTTRDYFKKHPYDLIIKTIDNKEEYRDFLEKYKEAYRGNKTMTIQKKVRNEHKLSIEDTQMYDLNDEKEIKRTA